jgi:hypothetical protein
MQPDFQKQKEWLDEVVSSRGHSIIFFPKFHCELNFIEMVWSQLKRILRASCTFNYKELKEKVPNILDHDIPLSFYRKAARYCYRFMDGYYKGMKGPMLDYAMKQYRGHRMFPSTFVLEEFEKSFDGYYKIKLEKLGVVDPKPYCEYSP